MRRLALAILLLPAIGWAWQELEAGKPTTVRLAGGESAHYQIKANSGDVIALECGPARVEIACSFSAPSGTKLAEVRTRGSALPISAIAAESGEYRLDVKGTVKGSPAGLAQVFLDRVRSSRDSDKLLVEADRMVRENFRTFSLGAPAEEIRAWLDAGGRAAELYRSAGEKRREVRLLGELAETQRLQGNFSQALATIRKAVPLANGLQDSLLQVGALFTMALVENALGDARGAAGTYQEVLELMRRTGDELGQARVLSDLAVVRSNLGETQEALTLLNEALALARKKQDRGYEAVTLSALANVYTSMGERRKALDFWERALALRRTLGDRAVLADALNSLGVGYGWVGEWHKSMALFEEALGLARAAGNRNQEASVLNNMGRAFEGLGEREKALERLQEAVKILRETGNRRTIGYTLTSIGRVERARQHYVEAEAALDEALRFRREVGDRSGEALTLYQVALVARDRGDWDAARTRSAEAIEVVESLRKSVAGDQFRAAYMSSVNDFYRLHADVLMQQHQAAEALATSERSRSRSLSEMVAEANLDIREGVDGALVAREQSLRASINAQADRMMQLRGRGTAVPPGMTKDFEAATAEFESVEAQIRAKSPRYASLVGVEPVKLEEAQKELLDGDTVLVEYLLGEPRSYAWAVTAGGMQSFVLASGKEIEGAARRWRELLGKESDEGQTNAAAKRVSDLVLRPLAQSLIKKRVLVVAEGALEYVPFGALPAPGATGFEAMVARHEVVSVPSATALAALRRETSGRRLAPKTVAVFADPVFASDDPRVGAKGPAAPMAASAQQTRAAELGLGRLSATRPEAEAILALAPAGGRKEMIGFDASLKAAMSPELAEYRMVHFATHGVVDSEHPELSALVLSLVDRNGKAQNGFLRLNEIYNLKLPAELVVLSACQTALGAEMKGEGLIGLTRGFMYAGARRVVSSLWKVDDQATGELMKRFYAGMLGPSRLSAAAALRAAQLEVAKQARWRSPYYWAGFVLQGEWR